MLVLLELGRRPRQRQQARQGESIGEGLGAIEGAVFGLMGLLLAFTFSGASRFDAKRQLVVEVGVVSLLCALLAGYGMGPSQRRNQLSILALTAILAITIYVIVDLEYPRLGLFQITDFDQLLVDVRASMR